MKRFFILCFVAITAMIHAQTWVSGIAVFDEPNFQGKHTFIANDWKGGRIDGKTYHIKSIYIPYGWEVWIFCKKNFKGHMQILEGRWDGEIINNFDWSNRVKSIRIVKKSLQYYPDSNEAEAAGKVALFNDQAFQGRHFFLTDDWKGGAVSGRFYHIESIRIPNGWEIWVYNKTRFRGDVKIITEHWDGLDPADKAWRNKVRSIRIVKKVYPTIHSPENILTEQL